MAVQLPNGITISIATAYGGAKTISAITNADPGVVSSTSHGYDDGDIVEITSGWSKLDGRVVRVDNKDVSVFDLEGIDTTSVELYPAGSGAGSCREITTWQQIQQILDATTAGGEMQFTNYSFLEQDFETQIPTQSSPMTFSLTIADDDSLPGYQAVLAAAEAREIRAIKLLLPNGSVLYASGYVSFNPVPTMTKNQVMGCKATLNLRSRPVRYAA